jgi:hypothetical protein
VDVVDFTDELTETCLDLYREADPDNGFTFCSAQDDKNQFRKYKTSPVSDALATKNTNLYPNTSDQEYYAVPQEITAYQIGCYNMPDNEPTDLEYDHSVQLEIRFGYGEKGYQALSLSNQGSITRFIFLMEYFQTGYEGHNRTTRDLTEDDCDFLHGELDYLRSLDWT